MNKLIIALALIAVVGVSYSMAGPVTDNSILEGAKVARKNAFNVFGSTINSARPSGTGYSTDSESDSGSEPSSPTSSSGSTIRRHDLHRRFRGHNGGRATRFDKHQEHSFVPVAPSPEPYEPEKYPTGFETAEQAAKRYIPRPALQYTEDY